MRKLTVNIKNCPTDHSDMGIIVAYMLLAPRVGGIYCLYSLITPIIYRRWHFPVKIASSVGGPPRPSERRQKYEMPKSLMCGQINLRGRNIMGEISPEGLRREAAAAAMVGSIL